MSKAKGDWVQSDFQDDGEVLYFFHPIDGGGGQAYVAMYDDGSVEFNGQGRKVVIKNVGTDKEKVVVEGAADLVCTL